MAPYFEHMCGDATSFTLLLQAPAGTALSACFSCGVSYIMSYIGALSPWRTAGYAVPLVSG